VGKVPTHVQEAVGNPRKGTKQDAFNPFSCAAGKLASRFRVAGKKILRSREAVYQKGKMFDTLSKTTFLVWFSSIFRFH